MGGLAIVGGAVVGYFLSDLLLGGVFTRSGLMVMANDRATFETVIEADAAKGNQIAMPRSVLANGDIELLIGGADDVEWLRLPRPATP